MALFDALRIPPQDDVSEKERRMAEVVRKFDQVVSDLPEILRQAEEVVMSLKDIRQEIETHRLMEEVAGYVHTEDAPEEGHPSGSHRV